MNYNFESSEFEIICPCCRKGYLVDADCELKQQVKLYEEGEHEITCPNCKIKFRLEIQHKFIYNTELLDENE